MAKQRGAELTGDWAKVKVLTQHLGPDIKKVIRRGMKGVGLKAEQIAVKHLQAQDLEWAALDEKYLERKIARGGSEKTLIDTSTMFSAITSIVVGHYGVFAGVQRNVSYKDGEDVAYIAEVMEYGSEARNIPARPLWQPTYEETIAWLKESNYFGKKVAEYIKSKKK